MVEAFVGRGFGGIWMVWMVGHLDGWASIGIVGQGRGLIGQGWGFGLLRIWLLRICMVDDFVGRDLGG